MKTSGKKIRVMAAMPGLLRLDGVAPELSVEPYPPGFGLLTSLRAFLHARQFDYILMNGAPRILLHLCFWKLIMPFSRCRIIALDVLFSQPRSGLDRVKTFVRGRLLRRAHRILVYYRDTRGLQQTFGLPAALFDYVPFKINQFEVVTATRPTDEGYIFCGGKTRRDFKTLIEAVTGLDIPVKIVTTPNSDIIRHGSFLDENAVLPPNVEVVRLDGSGPPFVRLMAASRLVVLPLKPDISGVGIGVYIMAMALRKCVVISAGASVDGVLTPDLACIVPPGNPAALRAALVELWANDEKRRRIADCAHAYATELGDESTLAQSVARYLVADHATRHRGRQSHHAPAPDRETRPGGEYT